jgi:predicted GIY-YIG superfamily endonuclease
MTAVYIYALIDPDTDEVRYIGATDNIQRRMREHLAPSLKKSRKKAEWIIELKAEGKQPNLSILESCTEEDAVPVERKWIVHYKEADAPLLNVHAGGEGGGRCPRNFRNRIKQVAQN